MTLAEDLVTAAAEELAFGDGPRPDSPEDTQRLRNYLPDAARLVAVTLRWMARNEFVLWARWGSGTTIYPGVLADNVEEAGRG